MVCIRCKMVVKSELGKMGLLHAIVELGEVEVFSPMSMEQQLQLKKALLVSGLELMDDKKSVLIQKK